VTDLEAPMPLRPPPHCPTCACDEEYDPFAPPGPPRPDPYPLPAELIIYEETWEHWQGSPAEIARLARRADEWMNKQFTSFQHLPKARWYGADGKVAQQEFITQGHSVTTPLTSSGVTADRIGDEIAARRSLVRIVQIQSSGLWRSHPVDIFDRVPLVPLSVATPGPHPGASEASVPPQRIEIKFRTTAPAVTLRVIAAGPLLCAALQREMQPHVAAGARPRVWSPRRAGQLGVASGVAVGLAVGLPVGIPAGMLAGLFAAYTFGTAGDQLVRWAFPPLELIEDWEKSRWSQALTYTWQTVLFLIALVSVLLTIIFA
jgi:hypothetical protein